MTLQDLVYYVAKTCSQRALTLNMVAERCGWDAAQMMAFLQCELTPSVKTLQTVARELGLNAACLRELLNRR